MKMKTSELQGAALDRAVAKCLGYKVVDLKHDGRATFSDPFDDGALNEMFINYSTDWSLAGPIIERHWIELIPWPNESDENDRWQAIQNDLPIRRYYQGSTPLIAAMRCYVTNKLGDEVELPEELTK